MQVRRLLALLGFAYCCSPLLQWSFAVEPGEMLSDPALEARAREISKELRCLVCQNQSIDDSSADLARDLRLIVRQRLTAGDSDDQVLQYVTDRYGDFVLLRPPVKPATLVLWLAPPLLLIAGASPFPALIYGDDSDQAEEVRPLSPEERQRLDALLKTDSDRP